MVDNRTKVKKNILDKLDKFKKDVIAMDADAKVILFGSQATGKAGVESDIDVCVISENFGKDIFEEELLLKRMADKIDYLIEPVPMNSVDFNDKYSTLAFEVKRVGKSYPMVNDTVRRSETNRKMIL